MGGGVQPHESVTWVIWSGRSDEWGELCSGRDFIDYSFTMYKVFTITFATFSKKINKKIQ